MLNTAQCEDCGIVFPLQENPGCCIKCTKLQPHNRTSEEYLNILSFPQCQLCGVTRRNMIHALGDIQTCGSAACNLYAGAEDVELLENSTHPTSEKAPSLSRSAAATDIARTERVQHRLRISSGPALMSIVNPSLGSFTQNAKRAPVEEAQIVICWLARNSSQAGKVDTDLGKSYKSWPVSISMTDVKADITTQINIDWVRRRSVPLLPEDVSIRLDGNMTLQPNTSTLSVGDFYRHYTTGVNGSNGLQDLPPMWKSLKKTKLRVLALEMYIDHDRWLARVDSELFHGGKSKSKKSTTAKRVYVVDSDDETPVVKRNHSVMGSQFHVSNRTQRSVIVSHIAISLRKIICTIDDHSGAVVLEKTSVIVHGDLCDTPMCSGSMKHVYDLRTPDQKLVVKRFFRLSNDVTQGVSIDKNNSEMEAELTRLEIGKWFLRAFFKHARQRRVVVDETIMFAEAFLGEEIGPTASPASESDGFDEKIRWLVETRRPTTVTRFSGTLLHTSANKYDLQSMTIYAFAHFVWRHGNKEMVFADIQGTATSVNGRDSLVLFDLMTHTTTGASGIGDFGLSGVKTFLRDHECTSMCMTLGLDKLITLRIPPAPVQHVAKKRVPPKAVANNELDSDSDVTVADGREVAVADVLDVDGED